MKYPNRLFIFPLKMTNFAIDGKILANMKRINILLVFTMTIWACQGQISTTGNR